MAAVCGRYLYYRFCRGNLVIAEPKELDATNFCDIGSGQSGQNYFLPDASPPRRTSCRTRNLAAQQVDLSRRRIHPSAFPPDLQSGRARRYSLVGTAQRQEIPLKSGQPLCYDCGRGVPRQCQESTLLPATRSLTSHLHNRCSMGQRRLPNASGQDTPAYQCNAPPQSMCKVTNDDAVASLIIAMSCDDTQQRSSIRSTED